MEIRDPSGQLLQPEDGVIDDRGKLFQVLPTEETVLLEQQIRVREVKGRSFGNPVYLPAGMIFKIFPQFTGIGSQTEMRKYWQQLYDIHVRDKSRAELTERKRQFQEGIKK